VIYAYHYREGGQSGWNYHHNPEGVVMAARLTQFVAEARLVR
jgi:hypothetical protein